MSSILFTIKNGVGKITLNRPEKYNSFNIPMGKQCQDSLDACANDPAVRAVLLTGTGKAFCAGQDLQEAIAPEPGIEAIVATTYNPIIQKIRAIPKPVVAAINGVAAGAGANIALACDITLAAETATFIQAFSKIGLIPDSAGTFFLPRIIGLQKATALMMLGDKVTAAQAEQLGMIYQVHPADTLLVTATKLAEKLAQMPTKGLGYTKQLLNESFNNNLQEQLALEQKLQAAAGATYDYQEGVNAFLEKRKPVFKGE